MKAIIVGSGLAGSVSARILNDKGWNVQIFETRNHIGGNCFDSLLNNVMVHNYGPHIFHTNNSDVWNFLNRFSTFNDFVCRTVANTSKGIIPIPFNKKTEEIVGDLSPEEIKQLIFVDYSEKQWGVEYNKIPKNITDRLLIKRNDNDDRYFCDNYQGIPKFGYTKMFEAMLDGITVHLGCNKDDWKKEKCDLVIYTGKIDEYFNYCYGNLPYRSLNFRHIVSKPRQEQIINECNKKVLYTRSYDQRHWLQQNVKQTVITYEYPCEHTPENDPFYPVLFEENKYLRIKYLQLLEKENNVLFLGRLANYKYFNMDDVIKLTLIMVRNIK